MGHTGWRSDRNAARHCRPADARRAATNRGWSSVRPVANTAVVTPTAGATQAATEMARSQGLGSRRQTSQLQNATSAMPSTSSEAFLTSASPRQPTVQQIRAEGGQGRPARPCVCDRGQVGPEQAEAVWPAKPAIARLQQSQVGGREQPRGGGPARRSGPAQQRERGVDSRELRQRPRVQARLLPGSLKAAREETTPGPGAPAVGGQLGEQLVGELPAPRRSLNRRAPSHHGATVVTGRPESVSSITAYGRGAS